MDNKFKSERRKTRLENVAKWVKTVLDKPRLIEEIAAWQAYRNKHHTKARWHFTTNDARIKLSRLYPQFE